MQDKNIFDPEKIVLIEFKMIKGQVDTAENFDMNKVVGYELDNTLQLGFNLEDKLSKADFTISIKTNSKGENETESIGNFHMIFIYSIDNLADLAKYEKNKGLNINPVLANALSSITYSTSRGILITRLQGTAMQNFILPVINPSKLIKNTQK